MSQRTVFFENVTHAHRPWVGWFLFRGDQVHFFDFEPHLRAMGWLRRLLQQERIQRIYIPSASQADSIAMDDAEGLFPQFSSHPLIQALGSLYSPEEAAPFFKKALLETRFRSVFIRRYLQEYSRRNPHQRVLLIPEISCHWEPDNHRFCPPGVRALSAAIRIIQDAAYNTAISSALFLHLFFIRIGRLLSRKIRTEAAVHVYPVEQEFQVKFQKKRGFDFLLDGKILTKQNTLFLVHPTGEGPWVQEAIRTGHRILRLSHFAQIRSPGGHLRNPPIHLKSGPLIKAALGFLLHPLTPRWIAEAAGRGLFVGMTHSALLERLKFKNYLYLNQEHLSQQWLNILIRRAGRQSWNFAFAIGGGYLYRPQSEFGHRQRLWAYQNCDHFVSMSSQLIRYHQAHPQRTRFYHNVGNIWSEQIGSFSRGEIQQLRREWFGPGAQDRKIISFFDTTFIEADNSPSTYSEALLWYRDIERLLDEEKHLWAVLKPSRAAWRFVDHRARWADPLGTEILNRWEVLKKHPRVYCAGDAGDPSAIIAASDLTVTFCFPRVRFSGNLYS